MGFWQVKNRKKGGGQPKKHKTQKKKKNQKKKKTKNDTVGTQASAGKRGLTELENCEKETNVCSHLKTPVGWKALRNSKLF